MQPHQVAVPVLDDMPMFDIGVIGEVFGMPRHDLLPRPYAVRVCTVGRRPVRTQGAMVTLVADAGLEGLESADTVVVPALASPDAPVPVDLLDALQRAHRRGARIASVCSGAFVLAAAGLLDGRRAATHWMHAATLAERFPAVRVDPAVLYVVDDSVATSAGTAAGLDLCLELLRHDHGTAIAAEVARRLVIPPHRQGGQAQYVSAPLPDAPDTALAPLLDWARARLDQALTLGVLAREAGVTTRTLTRRFTAELGMPPLRWLTAERVRRAQQLLEDTDLSVEDIAAQCGLGTAANLRTHFVRQTGVTPSTYRRAFSTAPGPGTYSASFSPSWEATNPSRS